MKLPSRQINGKASARIAGVAGLASTFWLAQAVAATLPERTPVPPAVTVLALQPLEMVETQLLTGTLVPREEVLVVPEIEGLRITEILVEEGDVVKAGQILANLSRDTINAQLQQWQASMIVSDAQIAQAKSQITQNEAALTQSTPALARALDLLKLGSGTQAILDQRSQEQRTNEARLANAKSGLSLAIAERANKDAQGTEIKVRLARTEIKAPVDGLISRRAARLGGVASALSDPMFRIIARSQIELEADVPEFNLPKLVKGQLANVFIGSDVSVGGEVRLVSAEVDKTTRLGKVRIALPADPRIHIGAFGRAIIEISRRTAIALPAAALQYEGADPYAQVVKDGHVVARKVQPGLMTQGMVEIQQGLSAGESVIARAGAFLHDGDAVTVIAAPGKAEVR